MEAQFVNNLNEITPKIWSSQEKTHQLRSILEGIKKKLLELETIRASQIDEAKELLQMRYLPSQINHPHKSGGETSSALPDFKPE